MMRSNLNLDSIKRSLSGLSESIKTARTNSDQISENVTKRNEARRESLSMSSKLFARRRDNMRRREKEDLIEAGGVMGAFKACLLYTSPSPRDLSTSRMPSSA